MYVSLNARFMIDRVSHAGPGECGEAGGGECEDGGKARHFTFATPRPCNRGKRGGRRLCGALQNVRVAVCRYLRAQTMCPGGRWYRRHGVTSLKAIAHFFYFLFFNEKLLCEAGRLTHRQMPAPSPLQMLQSRVAIRIARSRSAAQRLRQGGRRTGLRAPAVARKGNATAPDGGVKKKF